MTAKQKAIYLVKKFMPYTDTAGDNCFTNEAKIINITQAKSVALIMVNERLEELNFTHIGYGKAIMQGYQKTKNRYWNEVKAEILNVQPGDEVQCGVGKNNI